MSTTIIGSSANTLREEEALGSIPCGVGEEGEERGGEGKEKYYTTKITCQF